MAIPTTAWRNFLDANTGLLEDQPWPWQYGSDETIPVDFSDVLDAGETVTNPQATLRKLPAKSESDYLDAADGIAGVVVVGSTVLVHLANLERGRFYKLDVLIGAAGNRRGGNTIIRVSG